MLRILLTPDANSEGGSSNPSAEVAASKDVKVADSSSAETTDASGDTKELHDALKKRFNELEPKEDSQSTDKGEEGEAEAETPEKDKPESEKEGTEGEKEDAPEGSEEKEKEDEGPVPYARFKEKITEVNQLKESVQEFEPKVKAHDTLMTFCQDNGLSNEDFVNAMEIAALLKNEPTKALEKLKPILEGLGVLAGDTLPEDLEKDVAEGSMPKERAVELAQFRAKEKYQTNVKKLTAEQQQKKQQEAFVGAVQKTWADCGDNVRKSNPSFKPKDSGDKPDGLWELVNDKMVVLANDPKYQIKSPADAQRIFDDAYKAALATFKSFKGKPRATPKTLSSNGSSAHQPNGDPFKADNIQDGLMMYARNQGILKG